VKYQNDLTEWHFLYFGYSRKLRNAVGYVKFASRKETMTFTSINHYLSRQFLVYVAKDKFYPSFSGKVSHFKMHLCDNAYNPELPPDTKPTVPSPQPPPPPPPDKDLCLNKVKYLEVTPNNIAEVIRLLQERQKAYG
jgi:hypothetical protein